MIALVIVPTLLSLGLIVTAVEPSKSFMLQDIGSNIASLVAYGGYVLSTANNDIVQRSIETGQTIRTMRGNFELSLVLI
jgi:hypothetical protein